MRYNKNQDFAKGRGGLTPKLNFFRKMAHLSGEASKLVQLRVPQTGPQKNIFGGGTITIVFRQILDEDQKKVFARFWLRFSLNADLN